VFYLKNQADEKVAKTKIDCGIYTCFQLKSSLSIESHYMAS